MILDQYGKPIAPTKKKRSLRATGYDAINQWTDSDHWMYATPYTANREDTPEVRQRLRDAARFEFRNSSDCRGIVLKLATEVVGPGPRLEIEPRTPTESSTRAAQSLESFFNTEWAQEAEFARLLMTAMVEEIVGGEDFAVFQENKKLTTLSLDWRNYEADQFATPHAGYENWNRDPRVDGLEVDSKDNVIAFHKLKHHPGGDIVGYGSPDNYTRVSPDICCQLFRRERPSQYRGVSWLAPCVQLFGKLRRYSEAVLTAAENHASVLGTLETGYPPDQCAEEGDADYMNFGNGQLFVVPAGWKQSPWKAEQPVETYPEFRREILHEAISCILIPFNVAASDSSDFNFASGQLDHRIWDRVIDVIRNELERVLLNKFFDWWYRYAEANGRIPTQLGVFKHRWYWAPKSPIDPLKKAQSDQVKKDSNLLDEYDYWQREGLNWRDAIDQRLRMEQYELQRREQMNLPEQTDVTNDNQNTAETTQ